MSHVTSARRTGVIAALSAMVALVLSLHAASTARAIGPVIDLGSVKVSVLDRETARITASIDPLGLPVSVRTDCTTNVVVNGVTRVVNLTTQPIEIGPGALSAVPIAIDLPSLLSGTTYKCALVAASPLGTTSTSQFTLTTPALVVDPATGAPGTGTVGTRGATRCTITGTSKADVLKGTAKRDVICGLGGNDKIRGGGGRDLIIAGTGNDRVSGDAGNDRLLGNSGRDRVSGGRGNDRLNGNAGRDRLYGNAGRDRIYGNSGNDRVSLSDRRGGDFVSGGSGRDRAVVNRGDRVRSVERVVRR